MKQLTHIFFLFLSAVLIVNAVAAQPPAGKYNTDNYPEDRKAIDSLNGYDPSNLLNDDLISVGPEGKISYGFVQWTTPVPGLEDFRFKSFTPMPGMTVLRVYNGDAAVQQGGNLKAGVSLSPQHLWWQHTAGAAKGLGLEGVVGAA